MTAIGVTTADATMTTIAVLGSSLEIGGFTMTDGLTITAGMIDALATGIAGVIVANLSESISSVA